MNKLDERKTVNNEPDTLQGLLMVIAPYVEKHLESDFQSKQKRFTHLYWFAAILTLIIFAFSAGLIFYTERVDTGIAILTHVVALLAGAIGGGAFFKGSD